jgi:bisphosphoglycerate-dependent phosphoglycerate mutase
MENKNLDCINFLPCIHFICTNCHDKLIKNECPFCRSIISPEKEEDSYDSAENEYNDIEFEMLVLEEERRPKKKTKKFKRHEKRIMKLMNNNKEVFVTVDRNTFRVLSNITEN